MSKGEFGCTRCDARWNGLVTAHCSACHHTFSKIVAFDKHRTGPYGNGSRRCLEPSSVGLVDAGRAYPCWCVQGEDDWEFGDG